MYINGYPVNTVNVSCGGVNFTNMTTYYQATALSCIGQNVTVAYDQLTFYNATISSTTASRIDLGYTCFMYFKNDNNSVKVKSQTLDIDEVCVTFSCTIKAKLVNTPVTDLNLTFQSITTSINSIGLTSFTYYMLSLVRVNLTTDADAADVPLY